MHNAMFPHLADLETALDPRAKEIIVSDVRRVVVNGLLSIEQMYIDGVPLPLTALRPVTKQDPGKEPETIMMDMPIVTVSDDPAYGRCLIRSVLSNDGNWQLGSKIVIIGDWEEGPSERFISNLDVDSALSKKDDKISKLSQQLADAPSKADLDAKDKEIEELKKQLAANQAETATLSGQTNSNGQPANAESTPLGQGGAPAELTDEEKTALKVRATNLGINPTGKSYDKLKELIAEKEASGS